ncbi:MAG: type IV pilus secretin PilQ [Xanthomonadales bacterium]|nr:type IV pilus secretin PilQ [Xanthomonadales bacterium]
MIPGTGSTLKTPVLALAIALVSGSVWAGGTLQDLGYASGPGGSVDITLTLSEPAAELPVFTMDDPPRIVLDLPDTTNGLAERRKAIGVGATSAVSTAEAAGKTRVSVDLFRSAPYQVRADGNKVILSIGGGATSSASQALSNDPAKRIAATTEVANVDFRRSPQGSGRLILKLTGEGAASEMSVDGSKIVVRLANVALPDSLVQQLDVTDFATPVENVTIARVGNATELTLTAAGAFQPMAYQTGSEFVVEVDPVREAVVTADGQVIAPEKGYVGTPVTFNFQDIPVRTVLQLIAEESSLNIVAADSVQGNVTLRLINVPWDQALDLVLRAKSLDKRRDENVIWVAPQAEITEYEKAQADARIALEKRAELVTEYIAINYGSAEEIAKLLTDESKGSQQGGAGGGQEVQDRGGFLSERGTVSFDQRTNTLLLSDVPAKVEEIKRLVALLDRPVDQVLIEARIVIASESFARELGAKFGVSGAGDDSDGNIYTVSGSQAANNAMVGRAIDNRLANRPGLSGIAQDLDSLSSSRLGVNLPVVNPAGSIGFAILGADYLLDLELSALEEEGRGEVVSSPRVITANQREASIKQGDEIGYTTLQQSQGGAAQYTVAFKEIVLELLVTPTITQDGRVYLVLKVKKDQLAGFVQSPQGAVPQISKREISTAVLVDDGQTVVIGGVYEFSSREDLTKVPFLGDLPLLGNLFKTTNKESAKAELLIFVSPKVLAVTGKTAR